MGATTLLMPTQLSSQNTGQLSDPYSIEFVKYCIRMNATGYRTGTIAKHLPRLGDGAAIAVIKLFGPNKLCEAQTAKEVLPIIRGAFAHPELISREEDRRPTVTLLLLDYM